MNSADVIKSLLSVGEDNAVSAFELCRATNMESREVRAIIAAERLKGTVICSSVKGYYYPETPFELQQYLRRENARARSVKQGLKAAERLLKEWSS